MKCGTYMLENKAGKGKFFSPFLHFLWIPRQARAWCSELWPLSWDHKRKIESQGCQIASWHCWVTGLAMEQSTCRFLISEIINAFIIYETFLFWLHCEACGILVPRPGTEPKPRALEVRSLNHWTAREVPMRLLCRDHATKVYLSDHHLLEYYKLYMLFNIYIIHL